MNLRQPFVDCCSCTLIKTSTVHHNQEYSTMLSLVLDTCHTDSSVNVVPCPAVHIAEEYSVNLSVSVFSLGSALLLLSMLFCLSPLHNSVVHHVWYSVLRHRLTINVSPRERMLHPLTKGLTNMWQHTHTHIELKYLLEHFFVLPHVLSWYLIQSLSEGSLKGNNSELLDKTGCWKNKCVSSVLADWLMTGCHSNLDNTLINCWSN